LKIEWSEKFGDRFWESGFREGGFDEFIYENKRINDKIREKWIRIVESEEWNRWDKRRYKLGMRFIEYRDNRWWE